MQKEERIGMLELMDHEAIICDVLRLWEITPAGFYSASLLENTRVRAVLIVIVKSASPLLMILDILPTGKKRRYRKASMVAWDRLRAFYKIHKQKGWGKVRSGNVTAFIKIILEKRVDSNSPWVRG